MFGMTPNNSNHLDNIDMLKNEIVNFMFYLYLLAKTS